MSTGTPLFETLESRRMLSGDGPGGGGPGGGGLEPPLTPLVATVTPDITVTNEEDAATITYTVTREAAPPDEDLEVFLALGNIGDRDPAEEGLDFTAIPTSVTIPANQASEPFFVTIKDDKLTGGVDEGEALNEHFVIRITGFGDPDLPAPPPGEGPGVQIIDTPQWFYTDWELDVPQNFNPHSPSEDITTVIQDQWLDLDGISRVDTFYYRDSWEPLYDHAAQSIDWGEDAVLTFGISVGRATTWGVDFGVEVEGVGFSVNQDYTVSTTVASTQTHTAVAADNEKKSIVATLERRDVWQHTHYINSDTGEWASGWYSGHYLQPELNLIASGYTGQHSTVVYKITRAYLDEDSELRSLFENEGEPESPNRGGPDPVNWP